MIKYILLGVIQGITEFLPVSSSGHLVIMQKVLGISGQELSLSIILHLGTLLALLVFFAKDIIRLFGNIRLVFFILIVTLITGAIGLIGKDFFEGLFSSVKSVALSLFFTGLILLATKKIRDSKRQNIRITDAFFFGLSQGLAIIPGISRSGITISTLLFRKIERETCFKLSFLAAIPAIMGATLLEFKKINFAIKGEILNYSLGFIASFFAGLVSLWILVMFLRRQKFYYFGYYCIVVSLITLIFIK